MSNIITVGADYSPNTKYEFRVSKFIGELYIQKFVGIDWFYSCFCN